MVVTPAGSNTDIQPAKKKPPAWGLYCLLITQSHNHRPSHYNPPLIRTSTITTRMRLVRLVVCPFIIVCIFANTLADRLTGILQSVKDVALRLSLVAKVHID
jgi:hypothetical protein